MAQEAPGGQVIKDRGQGWPSGPQSRSLEVNLGSPPSFGGPRAGALSKPQGHAAIRPPGHLGQATMQGRQARGLPEALWPTALKGTGHHSKPRLDPKNRPPRGNSCQLPGDQQRKLPGGRGLTLHQLSQHCHPQPGQLEIRSTYQRNQYLKGDGPTCHVSDRCWVVFHAGNQSASPSPSTWGKGGLQGCGP